MNLNKLQEEMEKEFNEKINKGYFGWKTYRDKSREPIIEDIVEIKSFLSQSITKAYNQGKEDMAYEISQGRVFKVKL